MRPSLRASPPGGAQGAAQQPPVAEQEIAGMAPEDMGIAQIPMQSEPVMAAGGGLLAFADGGAPPFDPLETYKGYRERLPIEDPDAEQRRAIAEARTRAQREAQEAFLASRSQGEAMAGLEAALKKEAGEADDKRKEGLKMALIEAGLGMMASRSPYALSGIGEGAMQGVRSYGSSMKELEKAAQRRQELESKIEQARRAEKDGRARDALALTEQAATLAAQMSEKELAAAAAARGARDTQAAKLAETSARLEQERMQQEGAEKRANIAAAAARERAAASGTGANRAQLTALMASLKQRQAAISEQLKTGPGLFDKTVRQPLLEEQRRVEQDLLSIERALREALGMPESVLAPGAGGAGGAGAGVDLSKWGQPKVIPGR